MTTETDPIVGNWYYHHDKGQRFEVVAVDNTTSTVEIQDFDGNIDAIDLEAWYDMEIDLCEPPENWSGPMDIGEIDDYGTEVTDTDEDDWLEPYNEFGDND